MPSALVYSKFEFHLKAAAEQKRRRPIKLNKQRGEVGAAEVPCPVRLYFLW